MIALAAAMLLQSQSSAPTVDWLVHGTPNETCREWLERRSHPERRQVSVTWLEGFLSGINLSAGGRLTGIGAAALAEQIDHQCAPWPEQRVSAILIDFIPEVSLWEAATQLNGVVIDAEDVPPEQETPPPR